MLGGRVSGVGYRVSGITLLYLLLVAGRAVGQSPLAIRYDLERPGHDALHYDIAVILADSGSTFEAEVSTRWSLTGRLPLIINLDPVYRIASLTLDGRPAQFKREGDRLLVSLPAQSGKTVVTTVRYSGAPADGLVLRGGGQTRTMFADNWPNRARKWLASQDHPSDKATVAWRIEAPRGLTVVANGILQGIDTLPSGKLRWKFGIETPIPVYTMVLGAARLATTHLKPAMCELRCVPVSVLTYPEDSAWAVDGPFRRASEMIAFFSQLIAPFPYPELRHVQTSTIFGGMENSTLIFYDEKAIRNRRLSEATVFHESAHQWFGDAATELDWHHLWLSEGFASYAAALWAEHIGGDSALRVTMDNAKRVVIADTAVHERPIIDPAVTDLMKLLNSNNYPKGSWVLHSLRGLIGDSAFFRGLRRYYQTYEHKNALSSDFSRIMSAEAGEDLTWYFTQALTQPGYPILEVATTIAGGHLIVTAKQVQKREWGIYRMPNLMVRLGGQTVALPVQGAEGRVVTHWDSGAKPFVEVDPDGWWLVEVRQGAGGRGQEE